MALTVFILISLVMLYCGVHLIVRAFTKVKDGLFQELFCIVGLGLILGAICIFIAGMQGA
jgi:hypothetical protein